MTTPENQPNKIPASALYLGYSGLIPFVTLSTALWFVDESWKALAGNALFDYASVILAFMGAVYWGLQMQAHSRPDARLLVLSVIPALIAWFASFLPVSYGLSILYVAFTGLCILDSLSTKQGLLVAWYPKLRIPLTVIVVLSLISAQLALIL